MSLTEPLYPGGYYHIFNRGNNGEDLFISEANYHYFLKLYKRHIEPRTNTFAYCLMKNHFHLLIQVKDDLNESIISRSFSNFFNAYTKSFNNATNRHGSLFERPFKRKRIITQAHLIQVVFYIHNNPIKHTFTNRMADWKYSSFNGYLSDKPTLINAAECLSWFSNKEDFIQYHKTMQEASLDKELELDKFEPH